MEHLKTSYLGRKKFECFKRLLGVVIKMIYSEVKRVMIINNLMSLQTLPTYYFYSIFITKTLQLPKPPLLHNQRLHH